MIWDITKILLWLAALVGYILNIIRFCECDFEPSYKAEIIHGIGILTGLGSIFGYLNFGV